MRVLLDECVAQPLADALPDFEVSTARSMGWAGFKNGALIDRAAESGFERIFTVDREFGATYTGDLPVGIVVLAAGTLNPEKLRAHMPRVSAALTRVNPGEIVVLTPGAGA